MCKKISDSYRDVKILSCSFHGFKIFLIIKYTSYRFMKLTKPMKLNVFLVKQQKQNSFLKILSCDVNHKKKQPKAYNKKEYIFIKQIYLQKYFFN